MCKMVNKKIPANSYYKSLMKSMLLMGVIVPFRIKEGALFPFKLGIYLNEGGEMIQKELELPLGHVLCLTLDLFGGDPLFLEKLP